MSKKYTADEYISMINNSLMAYLSSEPSGAGETKMLEAMRYSVENGGKRIRPMLTIEFCRMCGGSVEAALPLACAIEFIHTYSLIHDDLPCMDNDDMRRGKPSCHKAFGEDIALLAGDGLLSLAFETLLSGDARAIGAQNMLMAARELAWASGAEGMVGGQVIDLESEGKEIDRPTLEAMHRGKTGAMIVVSALLGCYAAGADASCRDAARAYASRIGMAFQIIDDILDVEGDAAQLGKPTGSDAQNQKTTFYTLLGPDAARAEAARLTQEAKAAVQQKFGASGDVLCELADYLLSRTH